MFWTLFKKDFLRLRPYLGVFAGIVILQTLGSLRWVTDNYWLFKWLSEFGDILRGAYYLLAGIIVPLLIQDDALVGVTAFHLTRPISRWILLGEKVFFAALFMAFGPALLASLVVWNQGLQSLDSMAAFFSFLLEKCVFLSMVTVLAALTKNIRQYLIWAVAAMVVMTLAEGVKHAYQYELVHLKNPLLWDGRNYSLQWSIEVLEMVFQTFFIVFILVHQFISRNTKRSVKWILVAFIFLEIVKRFWSWDFLQLNALKLPFLDIGTNVEVSIDSSDLFVDESPTAWTKNNQYYKISAKETVAGLGPRQFAISQQIYNPALSYPDGGIIKEGGDAGEPKGVIGQYPTKRIGDRKYALALMDVFKNDTTIFPYGLTENWVKLTWISFAAFAKYKNVAGQYSAKETFDVYEFRITSEMPLQVGREGRVGSQTFKIFDVIEQKHGLRLIIEEKRRNFSTSMSNEDDINHFANTYSSYYNKDVYYDEAIYVLRNKKYKQIFFPVLSREAYKAEETLNGTMLCRYLGYRYIDDGKDYGALPQLDKKWLADAELVRIDAVRIGYFVKDVRYDGIKLGSKKKEFEVKNGLKVYSYETGEVMNEWPDVNSNQPVIVKEYYKNGALLAEWTYQKGVKNGIGREYYETGGLMYESAYKDDKLNGRVRKYSRKGKLMSDRLFQNDVDVGVFIK